MENKFVFKHTEPLSICTIDTLLLCRCCSLCFFDWNDGNKDQVSNGTHTQNRITMNIVKILSQSMSKKRKTKLLKTSFANRKMFDITNSNEARKIPSKTTPNILPCEMYNGFLSKLKWHYSHSDIIYATTKHTKLAVTINFVQKSRRKPFRETPEPQTIKNENRSLKFE